MTSVPTPICPCKPFSCKACQGKCLARLTLASRLHDLSIPKPGHTTGGSGRGGTQRDGGAMPVRAGRDIEGSARPGDICPSCPRGYRRQLSRTFLRKHEQSTSYLKPVESKTRTHNGRVGSARRTAHGGAGRSWAEQGADNSVGPEADRPCSSPRYHKQLF